MGVKLDDRVISININRDGHTRPIEKLGSTTPVILVYSGVGIITTIGAVIHCNDIKMSNHKTVPYPSFSFFYFFVLSTILLGR